MSDGVLARGSRSELARKSAVSDGISARAKQSMSRRCSRIHSPPKRVALGGILVQAAAKGKVRQNEYGAR
eukprot:scaffold26705_cov15-Prasinocladus_malaysianus.AAC.2